MNNYDRLLRDGQYAAVFDNAAVFDAAVFDNGVPRLTKNGCNLAEHNDEI